MIVKINSQQVDQVTPRYCGESIIIAIDSSKRNSGIAIGDEDGNLIDRIEFDGSQDGTTEVDALLLCLQQRQTMRQLLKGSIPFRVGIENIITKVSKDKETGMSVHLSRFKITAVFMSFISFFQDEYRITPELVNNQVWKARVLPREFCKREYGKGSLAYFKSINSKYRYCSDDVADAICILEYLCIKHSVKKACAITVPEVARRGFKCLLMDKDSTEGAAKSFLYNRAMSLHQNASVMSNSVGRGSCGVANIGIDDITVEEIYEYCVGEFEVRTPVLWVVVENAT